MKTPYCFFVLLIFAGCANIDRKPYENFEKNISAVSESMKASLSTSTIWSREDVIEKIATDPKVRASSYQIEPGLQYDWTMSERPAYFTFKDTEDKFSSLASVFINYARILSQLAGNEIQDEKSFSQMATDLNRHGIEATKDISNVGAGIPIISSAAIHLLRSYVDVKRLDYLEKAIAENQKSIEDYCSLSIKLVRVNRENLKKVYSGKFLATAVDWKLKTVEQRRNASRQLTDLNDHFLRNLSVLKELDRAFTLIPENHKNLITATQTNMESLKASVEKLQLLYQKTKSEALQ